MNRSKAKEVAATLIVAVVITLSLLGLKSVALHGWETVFAIIGFFVTLAAVCWSGVHLVNVIHPRAQQQDRPWPPPPGMDDR